MTARCHNDSCTVSWQEVTVGTGLAYQADVEMNASSLACVEGAGIGVVISPNAGNLISNPGNGLLASLPASVVVDLSGNPINQKVGPGADAGAPQESAPYAWTNSLGRDALVVVTGEFNFDYGILGPTHAFSYASGTGQKLSRFAPAAFVTPPPSGDYPSPYNAQVAMRLKANVGAPATTPQRSCRVDIGGSVFVSVATSAERKISRPAFAWAAKVPAGQTLNLRGDCFYEGPSQTINVMATPDAGTGLAGTGFELFNLQVAAVPL